MLAGFVVSATIFPAILLSPNHPEVMDKLFWSHFHQLAPLDSLFYRNMRINSGLTYMFQFSFYGAVLAYGNYRKRLIIFSIALGVFHALCVRYSHPIAYYLPGDHFAFVYTKLVLAYWPSIVATAAVAIWLVNQYARRKPISIRSLLGCLAIVACGLTLT